ncbi:C45 family autoproteolytic acyltransferase/hydolase [Streptomyces sp. AS58]|uniref:C45 family autoproteolytic acyltransferase/hydolase n=1 Tax=Streptomyces sp. AS58 TaxID=1519489 RepID=UPI0006ADED33|nr:C45 family peptidase [Streptomyces sp. AS58]
MTYPYVRVSGEPRERGRQYGSAARARIEVSLHGYAAAFGKSAGIDWPDARAMALPYRSLIAELDPSIIEEMEGIAEGAGLDFADILALNCRTEIMAASMVAKDLGPAKTDGCSALAVLPERTADGGVLLAQNWDWLVHSVDSVVVLEVIRDEGPNYVTAVEAGLLAKTGMNSAGLGVCTNFLVAQADGSRTGLPYHVLLRALMDQETLPDAYELLQRHPRAASANFLLGHNDGVAADIESEPGGADRLHLRMPDNGVLVHTNHFCSPIDRPDIALKLVPCSPFRFDRLTALLNARPGGVTVKKLTEMLADHASFPKSICAHADPRVDPLKQETTALGIAMDLRRGEVWLADGNPCVAPWRRLSISDGFAKPSSVTDPAFSPGYVR